MFETIDIWVISRLFKTIEKSTNEFDKFEYSNARSAIEDFFWNDFCDNYLELVKVRVYGENDNSSQESQMSAVHTIYHCLDTILRLFAPIVPHITEELYSHIFVKKHKEYGGSINSLNTWPQVKNYFYNNEAEAQGIKCVSILNAVRKLKAERNVSIKWPLHFLYAQSKNNQILLDKVANDLKNVTNATEILFQVREPKDGFGGQTQTDDGDKVVVEFAVEAN